MARGRSSYGVFRYASSSVAHGIALPIKNSPDRLRKFAGTAALGLLLSGSLSHGGAAATLTVTENVAVTTAANGAAGSPNAVRLIGGNIVVVWQGNPGGGEDQPYGRIFKPDWRPLTPIFRINARPDYRGWSPKAVALSSGNFAVVWEARTTSTAEWQKMKARFFSSAGSPLSTDFLVAKNLFRKNLSEELVATPAANGAFLATWPAKLGTVSDPGDEEMQSRLVTPPVAGASSQPGSIGPLIRHSKPGYTAFYPAGARLNNGRIVVTWMSDFIDGSSGEGFVYYRLRSSDNPNAPTPVFGPINTISPPPQPDVVQNLESEPSVAALAGGGFAISYTDRIPAESPNIAVRLFGPSGARGGELSVNLQREGTKGATTIIGLRGGGFVVGWTVSGGTAVENRGNFIRVFDAGNQPVTEDIKMPGSGSGPTELAALDGVGEFLLTYPTAKGLRARSYVVSP